MRGLEPDVGGIFATKDRPAHREQAFADDAGIVLVVSNGLTDLFLTLFAIDRFTGALSQVAGTVEFGRLAPGPQAVEGNASDAQFLGYDGEAETDPGESGGFGEAAEFDRAFTSAFDFLDAVGQIFGDKGFVCRIVENHAAIATGIVDPVPKVDRTDR